MRSPQFYLYSIHVLFFQGDKNTILLGEASSGSSSDPDSPESPSPLVPDHVVEVNHNHVTLTVKHSPFFRTKMPHLSAHQLALTVGVRKGRQCAYKPHPSSSSSRHSRAKEYKLWTKHNKSSGRMRRRIERPLLWLATTIVVVLMVVALLVAIFWLTGTYLYKPICTGLQTPHLAFSHY